MNEKLREASLQLERARKNARVARQELIDSSVKHAMAEDRWQLMYEQLFELDPRAAERIRTLDDECFAKLRKHVRDARKRMRRATPSEEEEEE